MEVGVLFQNPFIKEIFSKAHFLFEKPEVINEISFETKSPVEKNVLMVGDAAGMITPLCGNGMAMAIHSAFIASNQVTHFMNGETSRAELEMNYTRQWSERFSRRLWVGRKVQALFGGRTASNIAVNIAKHAPRLTHWLVSSTHGEEF